MSPSHITFGVTDQCTAACANCSGGFNQNGKNNLTSQQMCARIDEANELGWKINAICFTGGEALIRKNDLLHVSYYARDRGIKHISVMTNGWWGYRQGHARAMATELKNAGVTDIHFSTGIDHQKFIKEEVIINAVVATQEAGIHATIGVEAEKDEITQKRLESNPVLHKTGINGFTWIAWKTLETRGEEFSVVPILQESGCQELWNGCYIDDKNQIRPCCGQFCNMMPRLILGPELKKWEDRTWLHIWLAVDGPYFIWALVQDYQAKNNFYPIHKCLACFSVQSVPFFHTRALELWPKHEQSVLNRFNFIKSLKNNTESLKIEGKI